jgi:hypothetical protein
MAKDIDHYIVLLLLKLKDLENHHLFMNLIKPLVNIQFIDFFLKKETHFGDLFLQFLSLSMKKNLMLQT